VAHDGHDSGSGGSGSKWELAESVQQGRRELERQRVEKERTSVDDGLMLEGVVTPEGAEWDLGLVGAARVRSGRQRAEMAAAREFYKHRLEAFTHQLGGMVTVAKKKADLNVATALAQIDAEYLEQLQKLDIENYDARASLQQDLLRRTARQLEDAEAQDAPAFLKEQLIKSIVRQHEQAMEKIGGAGAVSLEDA